MCLQYLSVDKLAPAAMALLRAANSDTEIGRRGILACVLGHKKQSKGLISDKEIFETQQDDGGWIDIFETTFITAICRGRRVLKECYSMGLSWLGNVRNADGGWGKTDRDISRIPVTGMVLRLLPELADDASVTWLVSEWGKDIQRETRLTYKGAFFLMGLSASGVRSNDSPLIGKTYRFLFDEQNEDGGFGPWKNHPIGSDPWSTGIVLLGLLSYPDLVEREVVERAVEWLGRTQLPNGLWAYHYIEEGSAYAYWGLVEALKFLSKASP